MPAKWYAASLQSNREFQVQKYLQGHNVVHFLPTYSMMSQRQDRAVVLKRPLFSGYIFVHLEISGGQKTTVLKSPGVSGLVGFAGRPAVVADEVIRSLQIITGADGENVRPHPLVKVGQRVRVVDGPFKNATGILCDSGNQKKQLVVEVSFLGRAVAVPIEPQQAVPVLA